MSRRERATGDPKRSCKDCPEGSKRPAPFPGPRCDSHDLVFWRAQKAARHEKRVQGVYGLPPGGYGRLESFQGGRCWVCQRKIGVSKKAPLDHDHETGKPRGILCSNCNRWVVTLPIPALQRAIAYLEGITPASILGLSKDLESPS